MSNHTFVRGTMKTLGIKDGDIAVIGQGGTDKVAPTEGRVGVFTRHTASWWKVINPETGLTITGFGSASKRWVSR